MTMQQTSDDSQGTHGTTDTHRTPGTHEASGTREAPGAHVGVEQDDLEIRLADGEDLSGVLSVGHRTWPATYEPIAGPEYVLMGLAKWWTPDVVTTSIRQGRTLVAVDGAEVVGVATFGVQDDALALWKLYVLPEHHGRGIGSRLLDAVLDRALELGVERVVLSHIEGNRQAARFYAARGFIETHRESGGSGLPVSVWMERRLTAPHAGGSDAGDRA
jgi:GNAT superfamily N-acetyltransferase